MKSEAYTNFWLALIRMLEIMTLMVTIMSFITGTFSSEIRVTAVVMSIAWISAEDFARDFRRIARSMIRITQLILFLYLVRPEEMIADINSSPYLFIGIIILGIMSGMIIKH